MKVKTRCRHCGKLYLIASEYLGRVAQCKHCHGYFEMARYEEPATPPSETLTERPAAEQAPPAPPLEDQAPEGQSPESQSSEDQPPEDRPPEDRPPETPAQPAAAEAALPGQTEPPAGPGPASATQPVACPKCRYAADIPAATGYLKARCPQCGAWFKIKPLNKSRAGQKGGGRALRLALVLFLLAILVIGYFLAPTLWPHLFSQPLS